MKKVVFIIIIMFYVWVGDSDANENQSHYRPLNANDSHLDLAGLSKKPIVLANFTDLFHYTFSAILLLLPPAQMVWAGQNDTK